MQIINWTQLHIIILILQNCYGLIVDDDDTDSNEDIMRLDVSSESDTKKRNREATI